MDVQQIAQIAHETNRAYCDSIGDTSQTTWENAPEWQKDSAIAGVEFHLQCHAAGSPAAPSQSHESWLAQKKADGWKYGPVKDAEKKEHPCFVSYDELPVEQRLKDFLFSGVVASFFACAE